MEELRKKIYQEIGALREEVFWFEEATGISGNSPLKCILDETLDKIAELKVKP